MIRANAAIPNSKNEELLMKKLSQIDFALNDTILYLDAYPSCRKALSYYHSLLSAKKALSAEYERLYGPITAFGNESQDSWDWTKTPMPWEAP